MNIDRLFADGQELRVGKRIGKGGEGEVYSISNVPGYAVKAYLPTHVRERESKIRAMVSAKLAAAAPMVAFPHHVVVDAKGNFVGFMMKLVEKHMEIHELQTPSSRLQHFPKADYRFLVRVALNIARVFAQVHAAGCIVGDINQKSILVSSNATVALIDADSFQIAYGGRQYLCVVGVPEYTPPELQGKALRSVVRTPGHDGFGLAVCLFQILCMGRHPFSGRFTGNGDMPLEKAISEFRFAYSSRNTGMLPPPGTVRLQDLTAKVAQLFEIAFSPAHTGGRPTSSDWVAALTDLEASLRPCARNKLHHYARNAAECPWCRMEAEYGRPLFVDADLGGTTLPPGTFDPQRGHTLDLAALLAAVNGVAVPQAISVSLPNVVVPDAASKEAVAAKRHEQTVPLFRLAAAAVIAFAIYLFFAVNPVAGIVAGIVAAVLFNSGGGQAATFTDRFNAQAKRVKARVEQLQETSPVIRVVRKKAEAIAAIEGYKSLVNDFASVQANYDKVRRAKQLENFLTTHPIRTAHISKVSSADIASLASYGFTTALDVKRRDVQQAYGIGPVKSGSIARWLARIEGRFQFQPAYTPEDQNNIRKMQSEIIAKQRGTEESIKKMIEELRAETREFERWKGTRDPELARLCAEQAQIEADLRYLGLPVPVMPSIPPARVQQVAPSTTRYWQQPSAPSPRPSPSPLPGRTPTCPMCGSWMVRRVARKGARAGQAFWGCSRYPSCTGTRRI